MTGPYEMEGSVIRASNLDISRSPEKFEERLFEEVDKKSQTGFVPGPAVAAIDQYGLHRVDVELLRTRSSVDSSDSFRHREQASNRSTTT